MIRNTRELASFVAHDSFTFRRRVMAVRAKMPCYLYGKKVGPFTPIIDTMPPNDSWHEVIEVPSNLMGSDLTAFIEKHVEGLPVCE